MHFDIAILEFDKVKSLITKQAETALGKKLVNEITPTNNKLEIKRKLFETAHALKIVEEVSNPPFGGIRDLNEILQRAKINSVLRASEFLDVIGLIDGVNNNIRFYKQVKDNEIEDISLDEYFYKLESVPHLKKEIQLVITDDGEVSDNASALLRKIRNSINTKQNKIKDKLGQILSRNAKQLTESIVTIRNNRFVVPVKLSEKNNFKGSIIDYSGSGETCFMEPDSISQLNNEISSLKLSETREIERILRELTIKVADYHYSLTNNLNIISILDSIFAKAKYGMANECTMPIITEDEIYLIKAKHPLIDMEECVANTIAYDVDEKIIIITGPNTGGKTVALKTMGLLSIMVQSGLLIPVREESKTKIFDNIFADIGDEQSIEQSLSTFSSHMTRIINIIDNLTVGSLILLDELGSGTDPKEGASLAISILDYIRIRGVHVIATTHYPELKAYAYNKPEIINASVEFDVDSLSPTYRLMLGTPGKSNALLISERLGLSMDIINAAKENVLTSQTEVTDLINKLEKQGNTLDKKIRDYEELIVTGKDVVKENEILKKDLLKEKIDLKKKINIEQSQLIKDTKKEALNLIKQLEELKSRKDIKDHEIAELKYKAKNLYIEEIDVSSTLNFSYSPGDIVNILKFNRAGELIKKQKNGNWIVKMGSLNSQFSEDQIEFIEKRKETINNQSRMKSKVKKHVRPELDLRGMRYEEAKYALDKYIDDCLVGNIPYATIIHGFGTLTLRKLVKSYLESNNLVETHRDGEGSEGGNGATVVYFK